MIGLVGGLAAALLWGSATVCSSRSSRLIGAGSVLAWVMIVGSLVVLPLGALAGVPDVGRRTWLWLAVSGLASVAGLAVVYSALRRGKLGVIAPITATEGAIAAVIAVAAGESLAPGAGVLLVVIVVGVVLASMGEGGRDARAVGNDRLAATMAVVAAFLFGLGLFASGRAGDATGVLWVLVASRTIGLVAVAAPLAATRRLRLTRRALPLVVAGGFMEVAGMGAFVAAARDGVAIPAVVGSQFAAVAAVAGYVLFGERLRRVQVAGVGTILVGVALLSGLQA